MCVLNDGYWTHIIVWHADEDGGWIILSVWGYCLPVLKFYLLYKENNPTIILKNWFLSKVLNHRVTATVCFSHLSLNSISNRFSQITALFFFKDKDGITHTWCLEAVSDGWLMNQDTFLSFDIVKSRTASCFWSACSLSSNPSGVSYFYMYSPSKILSKNIKRVGKE